MALHAKLARELGLASYRRLETLQVDSSHPSKGEGPAWLLRASIAMDANTAQVEPAEITRRLFEASGATLVRASVTGLRRGAESVGVELLSGEVLEAKHVVLAMGPWMPVAESFFADGSVVFPMSNPASASLVYRGRPVLHHALFCSLDAASKTHLELYPRPNGELYVCGIGEGGSRSSKEMKTLSPTTELRPVKHRIEAAKSAMRKRKRMCNRCHILTTPSKVVREDELVGDEPVEQVCLRPCFLDALPAVGRLEQRVLVAGGGNCWGILWGPAMGEAMAQLVCDGRAKLDLTPFDPKRFSK
jgi:glycine/D-amino acid oxidase-like deaminating enzyme